MIALCKKVNELSVVFVGQMNNNYTLLDK